MSQVVIPFGDIDEVCLSCVSFDDIGPIVYHMKHVCSTNFFWFLQIRRSQHAFINPAVTIILRMGAGGHGVPPLGSPDG